MYYFVIRVSFVLPRPASWLPPPAPVFERLAERGWKPHRYFRYPTVPYRTVPYHTVSYHTVPYRTLPYRTIPYRTVPYRTVPCQYSCCLFRCLNHLCYIYIYIYIYIYPYTIHTHSLSLSIYIYIYSFFYCCVNIPRWYADWPQTAGARAKGLWSRSHTYIASTNVLFIHIPPNDLDPPKT